MFGRLLSSTSTEFLVGCRLEDLRHLPFGALVKTRWLGPTDERPPGELYGLVAWVQVPESAMARQVVVQPVATPGMLQDQRATVEPVEVRVLLVGYRTRGRVFHLLPPYPPEPMAELERCTEAEVADFTGTGRLGYLRHILRAGGDLPMPELLAAHLKQARVAHEKQGHADWIRRAVQRVIHLLRDDPPRLMWALDALSDALPEGLATEEWTSTTG